jgi:hypothetical protein
MFVIDRKRTVTAISLIAVLTLLASTQPTSAQTATLDVSDFERWSSRSFSGETTYTIGRENNMTVLSAQSAGAASAFYRQGRIDLSATPCLSWAWKIDSTAPAALNERAKSGDDYVARVYVVRRGGLAFWRAKTINYVWSANQAAGTRWANAYAGNNAQMWALSTGNAEAGQWQWQQRDIVADWQQAFAEDISSLDGIAIMTDGDDSASQLSAAYATLRFSAHNSLGQCELNSENTP